MILYLYEIDKKIHNYMPEADKYVLTRFTNLPHYYSCIKIYDTDKWNDFDSEEECIIHIWIKSKDFYAIAVNSNNDFYSENTIKFTWDYDEITDEYFKCSDCYEILKEPNEQPLCYICYRLLCDVCSDKRCDKCDKYVCGVCSLLDDEECKTC